MLSLHSLHQIAHAFTASLNAQSQDYSYALRALCEVHEDSPEYGALSQNSDIESYQQDATVDSHEIEDSQTRGTNIRHQV